MATMNTDAVVTGSGTAKTQSIYAVFDSAQEADRARQELAAQGAQASRLEGHTDARALDGEGDKATGIMGKIARAVQTFGGEDQEADRYSIHLHQGRTVLVVQAPSYQAAQALTGALTRHGGYDVTYFGDSTIEQMAERVDAARGVPPNDATATADEHSTGDR